MPNGLHGYRERRYQKAVELFCTRFFHLECISSWFSSNEMQGLDLSCGYCSQLSIPRYNVIDSITLENLATSFEDLEKNPIFQSDSEVINCLKKLKSLSEPLVNLLNSISIADEGSMQQIVTMIIQWIKGNINIELQPTAIRIVSQIFFRDVALKSLDHQVRHLSGLPYNK